MPLLRSFYPLEPQQRPLAEQQQQRRLECHLQRRTSYQARIPEYSPSAEQPQQQAVVAVDDETNTRRKLTFPFLWILLMSSSALVDVREKERKSLAPVFRLHPWECL